MIRSSQFWWRSGYLVLAAAVSMTAWYWWNLTVPQLGSNEQALASVDALFTAVNARDSRLLAHCEQRLETLAMDGRISAAANEHLSGIILDARTGGWERAARLLYDFMQAQYGLTADSPASLSR